MIRAEESVHSYCKKMVYIKKKVDFFLYFFFLSHRSFFFPLSSIILFHFTYLVQFSISKVINLRT